MSSIKFFISYTKVDRNWAEWIAWELETSGYTTELQAWDFQPGSNFVLKMDHATRVAERTIVVLSPDYFVSKYGPSEWAVAFKRDPTGENGIVLPIQVRDCKQQLAGLLSTISYIDLVGLNEAAARKVLLEGVQQARLKPLVKPSFPGKP